MIVFDQLKRNDPHLRVIMLAVLAGMICLIAGLWWVQIISYRHFSENQKAQSFRTVRIPAIRGKIMDRHGTALAENQHSAAARQPGDCAATSGHGSGRPLQRIQ